MPKHVKTSISGPLRGSHCSIPVGFSDTQGQRIVAQKRHKKRWQCRQARRIKGLVGWVKARPGVACYQRYGADVRWDVAHKTSHALAGDPRYKLFVFEVLKIKNMTVKAKRKQDEKGSGIKNGASAKSGLNTSILASTWGQIQRYLHYKACRQGKLVIEVPPFYSSQECAAGGHVHPDDPVSQSEFVRLSCRNADDADHDPGRVIARRGVGQFLEGRYIQEEKKPREITRIPVGPGGSEPTAKTQPTRGETKVSRKGGHVPVLWSLSQETLATSPIGI